MNLNDPQRLINDFSNARIVVIGDVMVDEYLWGKADRISPEAPVPVVRFRDKTSIPGGAANAAVNARKLGAVVSMIGVIGKDEAGSTARDLLREEGVDDGVVVSNTRPTTTKTRVVAGRHQVARVDVEETDDLSSDDEDGLIGAFESAVGQATGVLVSDYLKGALTPHVLAEVIRICRDRGVPCVVDPKRSDFRFYRGATVLTPNSAEATAAMKLIGKEIESFDRLEPLLEQLDDSALLVTRGDDGMTLLVASQPPLHVPPRPVQVFDVTGAGDTVAATMVVALASDAPLSEAAELSNIAASLVVAKSGTAAVSQSELLDAIET